MAHELMHVIQQRQGSSIQRRIQQQATSTSTKVPEYKPYNPGKMSQRYLKLSTVNRAKINEVVDRIFQKQTKVTRKLDKNNPKDLHLVRKWLLIRDNVMSKQSKVRLYHRLFEYMPEYLPRKIASYARHCFVRLPELAEDPFPATIKSNFTITFDNKNSGEYDPKPNHEPRLGAEYEVENPEDVRKMYKSICHNFDIANFNCCSCAYTALKASGAKPSPQCVDFPSQNEGTGLQEICTPGEKAKKLHQYTPYYESGKETLKEMWKKWSEIVTVP